MKKLVVLILILLQTGCSAYKENSANTNPTPVVNQEMTNNVKPQTVEKDNFEKNLKCAELFDKVKEREVNFRKTDPDRDASIPDWDASIQEIFYSPKTNSCLYVTHVKNSIKKYPYKFKTLMDVSQEIGTNPIEDLSCEFVSDYLEYEEYLRYIEKTGGLSEVEKIKKKDEQSCKLFDITVKSEYK